jgi:membrane protease YdiL (CAAX protease family)
MTDAKRQLMIAASPVALVGVCRAAQYAAAPFLGIWSWLPTMMLFWACIAGLVAWAGGAGAVRRWLRPASGSLVWRLLAVGVGLLSLPGFVEHWSVLRSPSVLSAWLAFSLLNPWFEESYWRGLLLDATSALGGILSACYSAVWFALSHPLIWGVHSTAMAHWVSVPVLAVVGALWALAYRRSGSLRWPIAGHMCANLFGLSVPVLLNLHVPYGE